MVKFTLEKNKTKIYFIISGDSFHHNGHNGDIFFHHRADGLDGGLKEDLTDELLPEDIPGLPRHRPGEMSPRYK